METAGARVLGFVMLGAVMAIGVAPGAAVDDPFSTAGTVGEQLPAAEGELLGLLVAGYRALEEGQYERAVEHYQAVAADAQSSELRFQALFGLGSAYTALGNHNGAMQALRLALEVQPEHTETLYLLAGAYAAEGRLDEAVSTLERVIVVAPDLVPAHHDLSLLYAHLGWHQQAADQNRKVLELDSDHLEAQIGLATALFHLGSYADAKAAFEILVELHPDNPRARYGLGMSRLMSGDQEGAVAEYRVLEEIEPALASDLYLKIFEVTEDD